MDLIEADQAFAEGGENAGSQIEQGMISGANQAASIIGGAVSGAAPQPSGTPRSLRSGGPFAAGEVLDIHKDERVVFNRPGTVLSQRASRAVVRESLSGAQIAKLERSLPAAARPVGISQVGINTHAMEGQLDRIYKELKRQGRTAPENVTYNVAESRDPYRSAARARRNDLARKTRRMGV